MSHITGPFLITCKRGYDDKDDAPDPNYSDNGDDDGHCRRARRFRRGENAAAGPNYGRVDYCWTLRFVDG